MDFATEPIWYYIYLPELLSLVFSVLFVFLVLQTGHICSGMLWNRWEPSIPWISYTSECGGDYCEQLAFPALIDASLGYHCKFHDRFHRSYTMGHFWFTLGAINLLCQEGKSPKVFYQLREGFFFVSPFSFQLCLTHLWQMAGTKPCKNTRHWTGITTSH